eukprot:TRINITY_DN11490_c0_g1_i1.p1 TRINITY_DN11490_c0_g1~~TRINITY_DN11490_c0_g1_i1.p1  ORF type:complete len:1512 (+),score=263.29 TRINITY_DN11490_c0_g1_i1:19-4554(+)
MPTTKGSAEPPAGIDLPGEPGACQKCGAPCLQWTWDAGLGLFRSRCSAISQKGRKSEHESFTPGSPVPWKTVRRIPRVKERDGWARDLKTAREEQVEQQSANVKVSETTAQEPAAEKAAATTAGIQRCAVVQQLKVPRGTRSRRWRAGILRTPQTVHSPTVKLAGNSSVAAAATSLVAGPAHDDNTDDCDDHDRDDEEDDGTDDSCSLSSLRSSERDLLSDYAHGEGDSDDIVAGDSDSDAGNADAEIVNQLAVTETGTMQQRACSYHDCGEVVGADMLRTEPRSLGEGEANSVERFESNSAGPYPPLALDAPDPASPMAAVQQQMSSLQPPAPWKLIKSSSYRNAVYYLNDRTLQSSINYTGRMPNLSPLLPPPSSWSKIMSNEYPGLVEFVPVESASGLHRQLIDILGVVPKLAACITTPRTREAQAPLTNGLTERGSDAASSGVSDEDCLHATCIVGCGESELLLSMGECHHTVCVRCAAQYIKTAINNVGGEGTDNILPEGLKCPGGSTYCKGVHASQCFVGMEVAKQISSKSLYHLADDEALTGNDIDKLWRLVFDKVVATANLNEDEERAYCMSCNSIHLCNKNVIECVCAYCSTRFCRRCSVAWHTGMSCAEYRELLSSSSLEQDTNDLIDATTKPCPKCKTRTSHYHGHGCHHIRPGQGCTACGKHWCYVCTGLWRDENNDRSCTCRMYCGDDIPQEFYAVDPYPHDTRCGCPICPDCRPNRPCPGCDGSCVVCTGRVKPGSLQLLQTRKRLALDALNAALTWVDVHDSPQKLVGAIDEGLVSGLSDEELSAAQQTLQTFQDKAKRCLEEAVKGADAAAVATALEHSKSLCLRAKGHQNSFCEAISNAEHTLQSLRTKDSALASLHAALHRDVATLADALQNGIWLGLPEDVISLAKRALEAKCNSLSSLLDTTHNISNLRAAIASAKQALKKVVAIVSHAVSSSLANSVQSAIGKAELLEFACREVQTAVELAHFGKVGWPSRLHGSIDQASKCGLVSTVLDGAKSILSACTTCLSIPRDMIPRFIGRGGANICEFAKKHNVKVDIKSDGDSGRGGDSDEVPVFMHLPQEAVAIAIQRFESHALPQLEVVRILEEAADSLKKLIASHLAQRQRKKQAEDSAVASLKAALHSDVPTLADSLQNGIRVGLPEDMLSQAKEALETKCQSLSFLLDTTHNTAKLSKSIAGAERSLVKILTLVPEAISSKLMESTRNARGKAEVLEAARRKLQHAVDLACRGRPAWPSHLHESMNQAFACGLVSTELDEARAISSMCTTRSSIPSEMKPAFVGRGGAHIRDFETKHQVNVHISSAVDSDEAPVFIYSSKQSVVFAVQEFKKHATTELKIIWSLEEAVKHLKEWTAKHQHRQQEKQGLAREELEKLARRGERDSRKDEGITKDRPGSSRMRSHADWSMDVSTDERSDDRRLRLCQPLPWDACRWRSDSREPTAVRQHRSFASGKKHGSIAQKDHRGHRNQQRRHDSRRRRHESNPRRNPSEGHKRRRH